MPGTVKVALGTTVTDGWTVLDINGNPLSGLTPPTGVTLTLSRQSGNSVVAASESVTWAEIGSTGRCYFQFTPVNLGLYFLDAQEVAANSLGQKLEFRYEMVTAGAGYAASYANAYCSQADIERWTSLTFGATGKPTATQVAAFAEGRASELTGICTLAGVSITPSTVTPDSVEQDMLRELNAMLAGADAIMAKFMQESPSKTEKAANIYEEAEKRIERLVAYLRDVRGGVGMRTHITAGEVTLAEVVTVEDSGFRDSITMREEF